MNSLCDNCCKCCKLIPALNDGKTVLRDGVHNINDYERSFLTPISQNEALNIDSNYVQHVQKIFPDAAFYSCKKMTDKCTVEEKFSFCKDFPSSPLAFIPENCTCLGYIFLKKEELKSKIRKIKEEIIEYEALIQTDYKNSKSYKKIADNLRRFIDKYAVYGSYDW